jgi:hypothetical protein
MEIPLFRFSETLKCFRAEIFRQLKDRFAYLDEELEYLRQIHRKAIKERDQRQIDHVLNVIDSNKADQEDWIDILMALLEPGASGDCIDVEKIEETLAARRARLATETASRLSPEGQALAIQPGRRAQDGDFSDRR